MEQTGTLIKPEHAQTYGPSAINRYGGAFLALLIIFPSAALLIFNQHDGPWIIGVIGTVLGLLAIGHIATCKVVLGDDSISFTYLMRTKTLAYEQIDGVRIRKNRGAYYIIYSKPNSKREMTISSNYALDENFERWATQLCDLDQRDKQEFEQAISQDPAYGATEEIRKATAARIRRNSSRLSLLAIVLLPWSLFYPHPILPLCLILIAEPLIAAMFVIFSSGRYSIIEMSRATGEVKGNLSFLIFTPPIALLIIEAQASVPTFPNSSASFFIPSAVTGLCLTLAIFAFSQRRNKFKTHTLFICAALFAHMLLTFDAINSLFDDAPFQTHRMLVKNKYTEKSKHIHYWLGLERRTDFSGPARIEVSRDFYTATDIGNAVCFHTHPGLLQETWQSFHHCET